MHTSEELENMTEVEKNRSKPATRIDLSTKPYLSRETDLYPNCDLYIWLRSCSRETDIPVVGRTTGKVPNWLRGSLYRNGPGLIEYENQTVNHIFDGAGLLHRFCIRNGRITYQNQLIRSKSYLQNAAEQRVTVSEFATPAAPDICKTVFHKVASLFTGLDEVFSDNSMISVYPIDGELFAFAETPFAHRFDPTTLRTTGRANLNDDFGFTSHASHPHVQRDGSAYHLGQTMGMSGPYYTMLKIPGKQKQRSNLRSRVSGVIDETSELSCDTESSSGFSGSEDEGSISPASSDRSFSSHASLDRRLSLDSRTTSQNATRINDLKEASPFLKGKIQFAVPSRWKMMPSYMHSFSVTKNYFILVEQPLGAPLPGVFKNIFQGKPLVNALKFCDNEMTILRLISKSTGQEHPVRFSTEAFFFLHTINAYEEADHVVLDICCYKNPRMLDCMYVEALKNGQSDPDYANLFRGRPKRFVLPLDPPKGKHGNLNTLPYTNSVATWTCSGSDVYINSEQLVDIGCETPRINYDVYNGIKYRYFYAISSDVDLENPGTLIKVDTQHKSFKTWSEKDVFPSEPVFVPNPEGNDEDDGIILSSLIYARGETHKAGILILDAKTWTEIARSVFTTPGPVTKCLHGWYAPNL